jgi:UDP-N-acetylmuramoylalanine--D-glutamate ligase
MANGSPPQVADVGLEQLRSARVLVAGARVTGKAIVAAIAPLCPEVTICDDDPAALDGHASAMTTTEAATRIATFDLVIASPGFAPTTPVLAAAAAAGVPIWGDVELAWRLDASGYYGPARRWLVVTGTNGKTTTTTMLHEILVAAGLRSVLCGNIGIPVVDALSGPAELLAVELSSFQLHWAPSLRPEAGAVLNVAEDHLDWHGSFAHYTAAKARALRGRVAIAGVDDPIAARMLADATAPVRVGFRFGEPGPGELGVRDGMLVDRAFAPELALAPVAGIPVPGPIGVLNALGASALSRAVDVASGAIADALSSFRPAPHRAHVVDVVGGVAYVDDSKATNPHAAAASISAYPRVIWIAGGMLKGASVDELVRQHANRLVAAVLVGTDRAVVANALSRHAPDVPVVEVAAGDDAVVQGASGIQETVVTDVTSGDQVMAKVVEVARRLARPGDTVLLAPAGASFDQFTGYSHRGDAFAAAVREISR